MVLGTGWYGADAGGNLPIRKAGPKATSSLSFWVTPSSDYQLTFRVSALSGNQILTIAANGETLGTFMLQMDWQDYSVTLPRQLISKADGLVSLELQHDHVDGVQGRDVSAAYDTLRIEEITP